MKLTKLGTVLSSTLVLAALTGCEVIGSSELKQKNVYTEYDVNFDSNHEKATFIATFFVSGATGTYVSLDSGSSITLDSVALQRETSIFNQVSYARTLGGVAESDLNRTFTFAYHNNENQDFVNPVRIPVPARLASHQATAVRMKSAFVVHWEGAETLQPGEYVSARIEMTDGQGSVSSTQDSHAPMGVITFTPEELRSLRPGWARLTLCKTSQRLPEQRPSAGGSLRVTSCGKLLSVTVENL